MNERQTRFVEAYLINPNGKQAAITAGFSPKTAESQASRLLRNVKVKAALDKAIAKRSERVEVKADDVLRDITRIASAAETAGEFGAALKGRELLGKHLGMWVDKVEHSGSIARPLQGKSPDEILTALKGKS